MPNWAMLPCDMNTLMARDLQEVPQSHTVNCGATLLFWERMMPMMCVYVCMHVCVCVFGNTCLHVCWKLAVEKCGKKKRHSSLTQRDTCSSGRAQVWHVWLVQTSTQDFYLFMSEGSIIFHFSLSVSPSRMFNNSQTAQVRVGSAGGVPADNIFI